MKFITGFLAFIAVAFVLSFALSNKQAITVGMWPMEDTVETPVYFVGLIPLLFGLLFGGVWGWLTGVPYRMRVRGLKKEVRSLSDKISQAENSGLIRVSPALRKKYLWNRHS